MKFFADGKSLPLWRISPGLPWSKLRNEYGTPADQQGDGNGVLTLAEVDAYEVAIRAKIEETRQKLQDPTLHRVDQVFLEGDIWSWENFDLEATAALRDRIQNPGWYVADVFASRVLSKVNRELDSLSASLGGGWPARDF